MSSTAHSNSSGVSVAREEDSARPWREGLLAQLEELAEWCGSHRLGADRAVLLNAMLHLDPANEVAHKGLKHVKQRDGSWKPPAKPTEFKNTNKQAEPESTQKRDALAAEVFERGKLALESAPLADRARLRGEWLTDLFAFHPDYEPARTYAGEARSGEDWVLVETVRAKEQREKLRELVSELVAAAPAPVAIEPSSAERALGIEWRHAFATPRVRVLTTGAEEEAKTAAVMCHAAIDFYSRLMGLTSDLPGSYTLHLLTDAASRDAFVVNWPGWSEAEREQVKTWAGCGVPGDIHQARWDADEAHRLDGAVRHTIGLLTLRELGFDHQRCAWAWEGVGIYLTRALVGTRYTWYSTAPESGDKETKDLLGRLLVKDVNWVNEFYQRAKRGRAPTLAKLCATPIDRFGADDVLASYSLAAYLIEGRADELPQLMRGIGGSEGAQAGDGAKPDIAEVLSRLFDGDLRQGDQRLVRWLSERR